MYCTKCGSEFGETTNYCVSCGAARDTLKQPEFIPATSLESTAKQEVILLVYRAIQGDESVWGEIFEKTHRYVYYYALRFLHSEQDAQDITQEVYIQAIR